MTNTNDWITDKILAQEDSMIAALSAKRLKEAEGRDTPPATDLPPPVEVDAAAERQAFQELLALMAAKDEGDADTVINGIALADFDRDTFTPTERDTPEPTET